MKVRHVMRVVALFAVMLPFGYPAPSNAAQGRLPNASAPMLVVVTFRSSERKLGVDFAATVRDKIQGDVSSRDLQVQAKQNVDATLQASGYDMTAALTEGDANLLATQLRADEYMEGTINKNAAGGLTADARLVLTYDMKLVQPLGTFEGAKAGDVANQISKAFQAAQKVFGEVSKCRSARRDNKAVEALAVVQSGLAVYPKSTMLRICELAVFVDQNKPPAAVLKVAGEILAIDPGNQAALEAEADAYEKLGDTKAKITALQQLLAANPADTKLQQAVVYELAAAGQYDFALKVIAKTMDDNPDNVAIAKLYWQLLYANHDFKTMVRIGDEMIRVDTSLADTTYFDRTIDAFRSDSQYAKAAGVAAQATKKYPKRADYWAQRGQMELKAGQTIPAIASLERALEIDPKTPGARLIIITSFVDAAEYDSAMVAMHEAVANGQDGNTIGQIANTVANRYLKFVNDSTNQARRVAGFQKVIAYASYADTVAKDRAIKNNAEFLKGVSSYFIATLTINDVIAQKSCDGAKQLQDVLVNAQLELPVGGASNPDLVKTLMPSVQQMSASAEQAVKLYCARPKKP